MRGKVRYTVWGKAALAAVVTGALVAPSAGAAVAQTEPDPAWSVAALWTYKEGTATAGRTATEALVWRVTVRVPADLTHVRVVEHSDDAAVGAVSAPRGEGRFVFTLVHDSVRRTAPVDVDVTDRAGTVLWSTTLSETADYSQYSTHASALTIDKVSSGRQAVGQPVTVSGTATNGSNPNLSGTVVLYDLDYRPCPDGGPRQVCGQSLRKVGSVALGRDGTAAWEARVVVREDTNLLATHCVDLSDCAFYGSTPTWTEGPTVKAAWNPVVFAPWETTVRKRTPVKVAIPTTPSGVPLTLRAKVGGKWQVVGRGTSKGRKYTRVAVKLPAAGKALLRATAGARRWAVADAEGDTSWLTQSVQAGRSKPVVVKVRPRR